MQEEVDLKEQYNMQFQGDINKLKDQVNEKEQVIEELTSNLYKKGE